jgi:hypothetical protein
MAAAIFEQPPVGLKTAVIQLVMVVLSFLGAGLFALGLSGGLNLQFLILPETTAGCGPEQGHMEDKIKGESPSGGVDERA